MFGHDQILFPAIGIAALLFTAWMAVDAYRRQPDHYWAWIILIFPPFGAATYFAVFVVPRFWGHSDLFVGLLRKREIRELEREIHQLDKAYHHARLADVYRKQGRWSDARASYEAALQRDPSSTEIKVRLGYVLMALKEPATASPYLEEALAKDPQTDYGELMLQAARCRLQLGDEKGARELYANLTSRYTYAQARLEYAELLDAADDEAGALQQLEKIVNEAKFAPAAVRRRDREAIRQADVLLKSFRRTHGG
jgi:hypothetical protein